MLPLFPLTAVLLPDQELSLKVMDSRYKYLLQKCIENGERFGVVYCFDYDDEMGSTATVGCIANIIKHELLEDGSYHLTIRGGARFAVGEKVEYENLLFARNPVKLNDHMDVYPSDPLIRTARSYANIYQDLLIDVDPTLVEVESDFGMVSPDDSFKIIDLMLLDEEKRQKSLETDSIRQRFELSVQYLMREIETLRFLMVEPDEGQRVAAIN